MSGSTTPQPPERSTLDVEELRRLLEKATPGPWQARPDPHHGDETLVVTDVRWAGASYVKIATCDQPRGDVPGQADTELIVALRNQLPAILAALEERERVMPALQGLLGLIDLLEASARLRDGSGYGIANVTAVVNVLRQADAVKSALAARKAEEVRPDV